MIPLSIVTGPAAVIPLDDVSTDVIIPTRHSLTSDRDSMGEHAFEALRCGADGVPDPNFPLNRPELQQAPFLIAGRNFACGSSREPAVWALAAIGIRVVVAQSFGDIFAQNATKNGMLALTLPADKWAEVRDAAMSGPLRLDLEEQVITWKSNRVAFSISARRRAALIHGLDEIAATLAMIGRVDAFQAEDKAVRPWVYQLRRQAALSSATIADPRDSPE
jgi:3-isopropylmalate/(R)-2-methylmalate dehydratase small subunit